jgi:uncharacterized membrane protein YoaK (UPF0700 family)
MRWSLSDAQSLTAGYADTSGFLALKGLFTAHVTGNFVTLGSSLVFGTSGALAKTLALPMFCIAVFFSRLLAFRLKQSGHRPFRSLLRLQVLLLTLCAGLAVWLGPFDDPDAGPGLAVGLLLISAMAIQNAAHRVYLTHAPPSTIMTGTTTQLMLDLAEMAKGSQREIAGAVPTRIKRLATSVVVFAAGCALSALLYARVTEWCFCLLPVFGVATLMMREEITAADSHG